MISYLRDRQFLEFESAPLIDSDGYFVIRSDREEWDGMAGAVSEPMQRDDFDIDAEARLSADAHQMACQEYSSQRFAAA